MRTRGTSRAAREVGGGSARDLDRDVEDHTAARLQAAAGANRTSRPTLSRGHLVCKTCLMEAFRVSVIAHHACDHGSATVGTDDGAACGLAPPETVAETAVAAAAMEAAAQTAETAHRSTSVAGNQRVEVQELGACGHASAGCCSCWLKANLLCRRPTPYASVRRSP